MNTIERILTVFEHKEADKIPIYTHIDNAEAVEKLAGAPLEKDPLRVTADAIINAGIDMTSGLVIPAHEEIRSPVTINGEERFFITKKDGYSVWMESRPFKTPEEAYEWSAEHWKIRDRERIHEEALQCVETRQKHQELLGDHCLLINHVPYVSFEAIFHAIDFEPFSYMMYDEPQLMSDILDIMLENALIASEVYIHQGATPVIRVNDDLAFKSGPLVSIDWMAREFFPRQKILVSEYKKHGIKVMFHSCGNVTSLLPHIIDTGADAIQPLEITAGCDLKQIKKDYGDQLVLMGNVDTNILKLGTEEDIYNDVKRCIDDAADDGGYFMEAAGGFANASPENVITFFNAARELGIRQMQSVEKYA